MGRDASKPQDDPRAENAALTTYHVRRARSGDEVSLAWVIERVTPLLRAAAEYRLGARLQSICDADDIVQEVWLVALPRLKELSSRDDRFTPVLLKFLSTTLRHKITRLVEKHIIGKPKPAKSGADTESDPLDAVADPVTTMVRRLVRAERRDAVQAAIASLDPRDRELVILRGIEGQPYKAIGVILREDPAVLAVRYQRALAKLRRELPGSVLDEVEAEELGTD